MVAGLFAVVTVGGGVADPLRLAVAASAGVGEVLVEALPQACSEGVLLVGKLVDEVSGIAPEGEVRALFVVVVIEGA